MIWYWRLKQALAWWQCVFGTVEIQYQAAIVWVISYETLMMGV